MANEVDTEIVVHVPLTSSLDDDKEDVGNPAKFVSSASKTGKVDLFLSKGSASAKYTAMGLNWDYAETRQQSPERLTSLEDLVGLYRFEVPIGGIWPKKIFLCIKCEA